MAVDKSCSVCGQPDYRKCDCPWHLPFGQWVATARDRLWAALRGG